VKTIKSTFEPDTFRVAAEKGILKIIIIFPNDEHVFIA